MNLNGFFIDTNASNEQYLFINVDSFSVLIKREDEGIVADVYSLHFAGEPITSTYAFHSEVSKEDEHD